MSERTMCIKCGLRPGMYKRGTKCYRCRYASEEAYLAANQRNPDSVQSALENQRALYEQRKQDGICVRCYKTHDSGNAYCPACLSVLNAPKFAIGQIFNGRQIVDIQTLKVSPPPEGFNDKRPFHYKRHYLLDCLVCHTQVWVKMHNDGNKTPGCRCQINCPGGTGSPRKNFCDKCDRYMPSGKGPSGLCSKCFVPVIWTITHWLVRGRPYADTMPGSNNKTKAIQDTGLSAKAFRRKLIRDFLWKEQDGKCNFCTMPIPDPLDSSESVIEHNHETDTVRGLTHYLCNDLIGVLDACIREGASLPAIPTIVSGFISYMKIGAPK
jgi:Recombination endonuclease VII